MMDIAWRDFVDWASRTPEMIDAFNKDTGRSFCGPVSSPLDALIDDATDKTKDDAEAFVHWVTIHHWGWEYAPDAFKEKYPIDAIEAQE